MVNWVINLADLIIMRKSLLNACCGIGKVKVVGTSEIEICLNHSFYIKFAAELLKEIKNTLLVKGIFRYVHIRFYDWMNGGIFA